MIPVRSYIKLLHDYLRRQKVRVAALTLTMSLPISTVTPSGTSIGIRPTLDIDITPVFYHT